MKESSLHSRITKWVSDSYPYVSWLYKTSDKYRSGIPDFIGCTEGRFIGIEAKWNHKLTKIQEVTLKHIADAGGLAFVWKKEEVYLINHPEKTWDPKVTSLIEIALDY